MLLLRAVYRSGCALVTALLLATVVGGNVAQGGQNLAEPHPELSMPVSVRVMNEETGACWASSFDQDDVKRNEPGKFKAKSPTP